MSIISLYVINLSILSNNLTRFWLKVKIVIVKTASLYYLSITGNNRSKIPYFIPRIAIIRFFVLWLHLSEKTFKPDIVPKTTRIYKHKNLE